MLNTHPHLIKWDGAYAFRGREGVSQRTIHSLLHVLYLAICICTYILCTETLLKCFEEPGLILFQSSCGGGTFIHMTFKILQYMFQYVTNLEALQTSLLCTMAHLAKRHAIDMEITEALKEYFYLHWKASWISSFLFFFFFLFFKAPLTLVRIVTYNSQVCMHLIKKPTKILKILKNKSQLLTN